MSNKTKKPIASTVLDAVAASAADITFATGKLSVTGLSETVSINDAFAYTYADYAAGTASVKEYDFAAVTLLANSTYRFAVIVDCQIDFASGGGKEANQLIPIREYVVSTGTSVPSASDLRDAFIARINEDTQGRVTAASGGSGVLELTLDSILEGDFRYEAPAGTVETITTAFIAPAGTPALVTAAGNTPNPSGAYDTYVISFNKKRRHSAVGGGLVEYPEDVTIFFESTDTDNGDFATAMDDILDGSHTPVADYLGV